MLIEKKRYCDYMKKYKLSVCFIILIISGSFFKDVSGLNDKETAKLLLLEAKFELEKFYIGIKMAEKENVNMTILLNEFQNCVIMIRNSENKYLMGDYESSIVLSNQAIKKSEEIISKLEEITEEQILINKIKRKNQYTLIMIKFIIISITTLAVWSLFKQHYINKILKLKPEVI
jgi:hypothetical protein